MKKVWFITGSSRGLGKSLTQAVLAKGDLVAATARDTKKLGEFIVAYPEQVLAIELDVTNNQQVQQAIEDTISRFGRIDVLVNNAGFGITGAAEAFTEQQVRDQLEANLYAPIAITRQILPHMRKAGNGRIFQISSVGGRATSIGLSIYQTAKFGLSGFSDALAKEVAPLGIKVTAVEPGGFRTNWGGDSMTYAAHLEGYKIVDERVTAFKNGEFLPKGDPDKAAQIIIELADHAEPPVHLVLGNDALAFLTAADKVKHEEFKKWLPVTTSTDIDEHQ